MSGKIDARFGELFLRSAEDFYAYGVHLLFNDWWEAAPCDAIQVYVDAIEQHPEQGPLAAAGWFAPEIGVADLARYPEGSLGAAYRRFMTENDLMEHLAEGYRELHEAFEKDGKLNRLPAVLRYKVLRGYQTHDLHHVLTGYPATPYGELAIQAFGLAQTNFPYAAMWIAVVTAHMTLVDPALTVPAMDAITSGWALGRRARSIQFVKFEQMLDRPLRELRHDYGFMADPCALFPAELA
ncbi:Coq4 family protein [Sphingomonas sp. BN140010]|uniref:Coq4 family protein n=1 Tax=Sphingomonas arvum TaxID=2992113 RepID=A0ABT3JCU1_9SPHN|nr:Coq4 family protein [Sphingomonas sp. BN140010]MCW3796896.1 Coq4 family protein [Sphingomonas sp. BN140010]